MILPPSVKLVEVGPRDGLQNETKIIPTDIKIELINRLSETGLSVIEATSFVSPKWIPQLADHAEVFQKIEKKNSISYPVFVPNLKGFELALEAGVKDIAVFTTPSEQFCERNTNSSVAESLEAIEKITRKALTHGVRVRAYISCVLGCPFEGDIKPEAVAELAARCVEFGCFEVSLGDTIGVGTALKNKILLETVAKKIPREKIAVHYHDTFGQALVNIYVALESGIHIIDSSVAGLGGCPYAKGATGNVATEDVVYLLNGLGIKTGVDLNKLVEVGRFIANFTSRSIQSKVNIAVGKNK